VDAAGRDNGADIRVDLRAPFRTKAVRNFSVMRCVGNPEYRGSLKTSADLVLEEASFVSLRDTENPPLYQLACSLLCAVISLPAHKALEAA
jgi:hypothetical protein